MRSREKSRAESINAPPGEQQNYRHTTREVWVCDYAPHGNTICATRIAQYGHSSMRRITSQWLRLSTETFRHGKNPVALFPMKKPLCREGGEPEQGAAVRDDRQLHESRCSRSSPPCEPPLLRVKFRGMGVVPWFHMPESEFPSALANPVHVPPTAGTVKLSVWPSARMFVHGIATMPISELSAVPLRLPFGVTVKCSLTW